MIRILALALTLLSAPVLFAQISPAGGFTDDSVVSSLDNARAMAFAPDGRLFYTEFESGQIMMIDDPAGTPGAPTVFATVTGRKTPATGDTGVHGICFHPNFPSSLGVNTDRYIYVCYTGGAGSATYTIKRFTEDTASIGTGTNETTVVPEFTMSGADANFGGRIAFGPDGNLYAGVGDGGIGLSGQFAQDTADPRGKIHRYTESGSIPLNNPINGNPMYAFGFRNPRGLAFNPNTDELFTVDTGNPATSGEDELNIVLAGENYGWDSNNLSGEQGNPDYTDPAWTFAPGFDPSGVAFYPTTATAFPTAGYRSGVVYVGSEAASGSVVRVVLSGGNERLGVAQWTLAQGFNDPVRDVAFGPDGHLYVLTDGELVRLRYTGNTSSNDPVAAAGNDQEVDENTPVTLDASGSSDNDASDILRYTWRQVGGSTLVEITDADTATPDFTAPSVSFSESFTFEVIVEDGNGGVDSDFVLVTVNNTGNDDGGGPKTVADNGFEPLGEGGCSSGGEQSWLWLLLAAAAAFAVAIRGNRASQ